MSAREVIAGVIEDDLDIDRYYADQSADLILAALAAEGWSVVRQPGRNPQHDRIGYPAATTYMNGWNDCLDEIDRLTKDGSE